MWFTILISLVLAPIVWLIVDVLLHYKTPRTPKSFTRFTPKTIKRSAKDDSSRDTFSLKKVPEDLDYIIVGSGIGGLMCGGLLAKLGKKVLVLEQHYVAGGCTHEFEAKGYTFDSGVHYVGRIEKYGKLVDLVSHPDHKVEWAQMGDEKDGFPYDEIVLGKDKPHCFRAGRARFIKDLSAKFPQEKENIERYVALVDKVNKSAGLHFENRVLPKWLRSLMIPLLPKLTGKFYAYARRTAWDVITNDITSNKHLAAILVGQYGDYGASPEDVSFFIHAGVAAHYFGGGFYPVGGTQQISRAIVPVIEAAGGRVLVRAAVKQILVENGRASGVELFKNGITIRAKQGVISAAGAYNTFQHLLPAPVVQQYKLPRVGKELGASVAHVCAFVGLKGTTADLGIRSTNTWFVPCDAGYDFKSPKARYLKDPLSKDSDMGLFISFPSAKDPTWQSRFPGTSTCCIIGEAPFEWFEEWEEARQGNRGVEYKQFKGAFGDRMLEGLYRLFPKTKGAVEYIDTSTPLTSKFFLFSHNGASYGMDSSPQRFAGPSKDALAPETALPGLYLTGVDITTPGFAGGVMAGVLTAMRLAGYGSIPDLLTSRNLIEDLMSLEK